ncbi:hypothetical protein ANCCEY_09571 [Ancylostoma ceylanicum]|uniref:Uncharacterized protein n=1 Tax=Ancylostoma ceylanicum TaxID=53326 RepID=A0A0D6LJM9_9BILA|nr:hypothetical protein ANCCEY_09571 [Ancylostoma ceylanicum]
MAFPASAGRGVTQVIDRCEAAKTSGFLDLEAVLSEGPLTSVSQKSLAILCWRCRVVTELSPQA